MADIQNKLVLRSEKNTPLSIREIDGNLKYLENLILSITDKYLYRLYANGPSASGTVLNYGTFPPTLGVEYAAAFQSRFMDVGAEENITLSLTSPVVSSWQDDINLSTGGGPNAGGRGWSFAVGVWNGSDWVEIEKIAMPSWDWVPPGPPNFSEGFLEWVEIRDYFNNLPNVTCVLDDIESRLEFTWNVNVPCGQTYDLRWSLVDENNNDVSSIEYPNGFKGVGNPTIVDCGTVSVGTLEIGRRVEFVFDNNYLYGQPDIPFFPADQLWEQFNLNPFYINSPDQFSEWGTYILSIQPNTPGPGSASIFDFLITRAERVFNSILFPVGSPMASSDAFVFQTTMISGPTAFSFGEFNATDKQFFISLNYDGPGGRPPYIKTSSFELSEGQFDYNLLMSTTTFVSVDLNPNVSGNKSTWINELRGLVNSNIKQNFIISAINNPNNTIIFEVSSITEFSQTKTNILGRLVSQSGTILENQVCTFNFMAPVVEPGGPILQYNGGFWLFKNPADIPSDPDPVFTPYLPDPGYFWDTEGYMNGLQTQIEVGRNYRFNFSPTASDGSTLNYISWFDYIYRVGGYSDPNHMFGDGLSTLHIVEYNPLNTNPTNSIVSRGDFRITGYPNYGFGKTSSSIALECYNGQGSLINSIGLGGDELVGPKLFFVSYTIVPLGGSRSGQTGPVGPTGNSSLISINRNSSPENFPNSFDYFETSTFQGNLLNLEVNTYDLLSGTTSIVYKPLQKLIESGLGTIVNIVQNDNESCYITMRAKSFTEFTNTCIFSGPIVDKGEDFDYLSDSILTYYVYPEYDPTPIIPINGSFWDFIGTTPSGPTPSSGQFFNRDNVDDIIVGVTYSFDFSRYDADSASNDYQKWFDHLYESGNTQNSVLHLSEYNPTNTSPTQSTISFGDFKILSFNGKSTSFDVMCMSGKGSLSKITPGGGLSPKTFFVSYTIVGNSGGGIGGSTRTDAFTSVTSTTINHNFGFYPMVQVFDTSGSLFIPENIVHQSINTLVVNFSSNSSGTIITSGGSPTGSLVLSSTIVPTYSGSTGQYGETRLGLSESNPYLYVYTDQWYRFLGATF